MAARLSPGRMPASSAGELANGATIVNPPKGDTGPNCSNRIPVSRDSKTGFAFRCCIRACWESKIARMTRVSKL